jgi:hypothetical protein
MNNDINICAHPGCNVQIQDHHKFCKKHHAEFLKQQRLARKMKTKVKKMKPKTSDAYYLDAQGRVRAGMGLSRLREIDRLAWEASQEASN